MQLVDRGVFNILFYILVSEDSHSHMGGSHVVNCGLICVWKKAIHTWRCHWVFCYGDFRCAVHVDTFAFSLWNNGLTRSSCSDLFILWSPLYYVI